MNKISQAGWGKRHGGLWKWKQATYILKKEGAKLLQGGMPNYSAATELSLYLCSEEDCPEQEALAASARGQLWYSAAVHPQTGLLDDKELCKKELAKPCQVAPALLGSCALLRPWLFSCATAVPGPHHGACWSGYEPHLLPWLLSLRVDLPHNYGCVWQSLGLEVDPGYLHWTCSALLIWTVGEGFNSGGWDRQGHCAYLQCNGNTWHWFSAVPRATASRPLQYVCLRGERAPKWTGLLDVPTGRILHFYLR